MQNKITRVREAVTKAQPILLWLVAAWFAYSLMVNGLRKFEPDGFWSPAFQRWGYPAWFRILIGVLETAGAALILVPRVRHFGGVILFLVMFGALVTRLVFGTSWEDVASIAQLMFFFLFLVGYTTKKKETARIKPA